MSLLFFFVFVCCCMAASVLAKKLTMPAALTGGVLAAVIYAGVGWTGIALMGTFFILGTSVTSWKKKTKQTIGLAQAGKGRTTGQVLANGGAAAILGLLAIVVPSSAPLFLLMMAAAFSSATADTVSSELGSVYGRKFYDILSFKNGQRGLDGVISMEGLLFGAMGSAVIAAIYTIANGRTPDILFIIVAGTIGNLADSYLGATLERKGIIGNDAVNFLNTMFAALSILLLQQL